ncbi:hypothetical protein EQVG_00378 [Emiliania huxleyi virus 207]|nr:hypothetical protein ELVG_00437 [Emiliania huxleyi virus 203]AEP15787.1 hypothetical protein EQVG_00378 [Emiliania huxleyi virus 207]AEP16210.1 hypothetical protein ERVG_00335 [Emiliania huxleyi virus 208]
MKINNSKIAKYVLPELFIVLIMALFSRPLGALGDGTLVSTRSPPSQFTQWTFFVYILQRTVMQRLLLLALAAALNVRAYTVSSTEKVLPDAHDFGYDGYDSNSGYDFPYNYDLPLQNDNTIGTDTYTYTPTPTRSFWDVYMYTSRVQTLETTRDDARLQGILIQMRALARSYLDILYYKYLQHVPPLTSAE